MSLYTAYLAQLKKPFRKITRLEFLQPDNSVAFALGSSSTLKGVAGRDSRAFLQDGSLSVSLQNGQRRSASVTLSNLDTAFDYNVNKIWFGKRVRLSMGLVLPSGEDFYLPQGVFYITNPSNLIAYNQRTTTLSLSDKWVYLDGTLFGNLDSSYIIPNSTNIFTAISSILSLSRFDYSNSAPSEEQIDNVLPVFTSYYNGKTYSANMSDGSIIADIPMTNTPYEITENKGSSFATLILKLNDMLAGLIGYDATGALRIDPSQDDISDEDKPILHTFSIEGRNLIQISETPEPSNVFNSVLVSGEGLTDNVVWAKASNFDPRSDTNINLIGQKLYTEDKADYWNAEQCAALARWYLKRKTILQKSVSIQCGQAFHLRENGLVAIQRTDKPGAPLEKHLIQGYSIPLGETGAMTLNCTSVLDLPEFTVETFVS